LFHELQKQGLNVERQVSLPVIYDNLSLEEGFRLDMLVEDSLVLELKAVDEILPVHLAQILTYTIFSF
jgi:GxxExxY protein